MKEIVSRNQKAIKQLGNQHHSRPEKCKVNEKAENLFNSLASTL